MLPFFFGTVQRCISKQIEMAIVGGNLIFGDEELVYLFKLMKEIKEKISFAIDHQCNLVSSAVSFGLAWSRSVFSVKHKLDI